jgi:poly(3-hydroxybutyrate) depolymerase
VRPALLLLLAAAAAARAGELEERLRAVRLAERGERALAVARCLEANPSLEEVARALATAPGPLGATAGVERLEAEDETGRRRPYLLFVPGSVASSASPAPLAILLHGGVSRPDYLTEAECARLLEGGYYAAWRALAEESRVTLAMPLARADCVWWKPEGVAHVRAVLRDARRRVPVDDDRVTVGGFSDGGSAAYYLALAEPDPFSGFFPLNGHPAVASRGSGLQLYLANLAGTRIFAGMTQDDPLYPAATVLPAIAAAVEAGALVELVSRPDGGHQPVYLADVAGRIGLFCAGAPRPPAPAELSWTSADAASARREWLEILEWGAAEGDGAEPRDANPEIVSRRVRLGIVADEGFAGPGVRAAQVQAGSLAAGMGLRDGDLVDGIDGAAIGGLDALRAALDAKQPGEAIRLSARRDGERLELEGRIAEARPEALFRRERPAGHLRLRAAGNRVEILSRRNVRAARLLLPLGLFDPGAPVVVEGVPREVAPSLRLLLERYAADADSRRLVWGSVEVRFPPR